MDAAAGMIWIAALAEHRQAIGSQLRSGLWRATAIGRPTVLRPRPRDSSLGQSHSSRNVS